MAKPRRAARRRVSGRALVSSSLIAATAVATFAVWQLSDSEASVALPAAEESAVVEATSPSSPSSSPVPSASATATPAATSDASSVDWDAAIAGCKRSVAARDAVISRAATGIDHWSQHVQAQTDANAGKISVDDMKKSFMRTRLLGPSDVSHYRGALDAAADSSAGCSSKGAPADAAATLKRCAQRQSEQRPVLVAGARGMNDWISHLAAMRRNKNEHVHNAQQVWIDAWQAAPPNIKAFDRAAAKFQRAADC